jgi:ATP-dependent Clp protease ATP-binding subunit ClpA
MQVVRGVLRLLRGTDPRMAKVQADLRELPADQQKLRRPVMNGYNFTERVRKVLAMARVEAAELHHEYVGTEHILLGILREGEGVANRALRNLGVDEQQLRTAVVDYAKPGHNPTTAPDLPYTSRGKKVLELAMSEARQFGHSYVGTEHLLLGLLREEKGIAGQVLIAAGVNVDNTRHAVLNIIGSDRHMSPVKSMTAMFRNPKWNEPWTDLPEPIRRIVEAAYLAARAADRPIPGIADLFEATLLSSPDVSAAFTAREIEIDALIADVRARLNDHAGD